MYNLSLSDIERFWRYVPKGLSDNDCWNWLGPCFNKTRAQFCYQIGLYKQKHFVAARLIYLFYFGEYNFKLNICHTCDNELCINPNHLFLGTQLENIKDRHNKGRSKGAKGIKNCNAKLTREQVLFIRENFTKYTNKELQKIINLDRHNLAKVYYRESYKDVQ